MPREHIQFVTGRLAEFALRKTVEALAARAGFDYTIDVLPITVAALMSPEWIARKITPAAGATRVLIPGYCNPPLAPIEQVVGLPVEIGPKDLRDLPSWFGRPVAAPAYGDYDIEIIAEINHARRLSRDELLTTAAALAADGADLIDVGCEPGEPWRGVGEAVRLLRDAGHRVSIDSLEPVEIAAAVAAGAELVLSVNSTNRQAALDWGCEVVAVPDVPAGLVGLDETVEFLAAAGVPLRIDPVLEPISFGFAESLARYVDVRRRYPDAEMLMGIGNLTELTDADSAPINVLLLGVCEELGVRSVLTTQVINWARTSVRECDLARRLVYHAVKHRVLPKHLEPRLVALRDAQRHEYGPAWFEQLATAIKDNNLRVFAEGQQLHLVSRQLHLAGDDPFDLFDQLQAARDVPVDASHAFYLGYEMAKAVTALTLDKEYRQDQALDWGYLTRAEQSHRERQQATRGSQPTDTGPLPEGDA